MITSRIALLGIIALAGSFFTSEQAHAASYQHIDSLALQLQANSAKLYREFELHYSHSPEIHHLLSDARDLHRHSQHIHELAHHHGSLGHLASDLRTLDRSFHHLERLVQHMEIGLDHTFYRRVQDHPRHVQIVMQQMECDIHQLREDIAELTRHHHGGHGIDHGFEKGNAHVIGGRAIGEVRSNWTIGLNDLHLGRTRFARSFR